MINPQDYRIVFVTVDTRENAVNMTHILVGEQLAACCSIIPRITSVYEWKGEVQESEEFLIMIKTNASKYQALEERIKKFHSYEVPEIIAVTLSEGSSEYLDWLAGSLKL